MQGRAPGVDTVGRWIQKPTTESPSSQRVDSGSSEREADGPQDSCSHARDTQARDRKSQSQRSQPRRRSPQQQRSQPPRRSLRQSAKTARRGRQLRPRRLRPRQLRGRPRQKPTAAGSRAARSTAAKASTTPRTPAESPAARSPGHEGRLQGGRLQSARPPVDSATLAGAPVRDRRAARDRPRCSWGSASTTTTTFAVDGVDPVRVIRNHLRHRRTERGGQDDDAVHGHRSAASRRGHCARARRRRLGRPGHGQAQHGRAARPAEALRSAHRQPAALLRGRAARARPAPTVKARTADLAAAFGLEDALEPAGRRLLGWHDQEDRARRGDDPLAAGCSFSTSRSSRSTRCPLRTSSRSCRSTRPPAARSCSPATAWTSSSESATPWRSSSTARCSPREPCDRCAGAQSLEERFVELAGGRRSAEGMEWLHSFSD